MKTLPTDLPRTLEMIEQGIAAGWHIGAQVFVSLHGRVIVDQALGEARRGTLMTPSTMMLWFSSGKPITAGAIAQLWEQGMLALDDPVQRYIPEFGHQGKEAITIRHLLTHTAGFLRTWPWQDYHDLPGTR
jgi:CubicO group peptidase (beta-lactamase class C family)